MEEELIDILHRTCGGVVFKYDHRPMQYDVIQATHVHLLDGSAAVPGQRIVCGACGMPAYNFEFYPAGGFAE